MKILYLAVLLALSVKVFGQAERVRGMEAKTQPATIIVNTESKGTIVFKGAKPDPVNFFNSHLSFTAYIYTFSSAAEAENFASSFKASDPGIAFCSYTNNEAGGYYEFAFSVTDEHDQKWYLQLFKKNSLSFIRLDKGPESIDMLLEN